MNISVDEELGNHTGLAVVVKSATLPADAVADAERMHAQTVTLTINSPETYQLGVNFVNELKATAARLDADRVELKSSFLEGCRKIDSYFRAPIQRLEAAVAVVKRHLIAYDERARLEREEQARREREARRLQQEEADRIAREAAEKAQAAQREAAKAAESNDRESAIEARRKQLRAEADAAQAMNSAAEAAHAVDAPIAAPVAPPAVSGVARKKVWKWKKREGARVPDVYLMPDEAKIQATVDRLKDLAQETLGDWIIVTSEDQLAIGRGRK